MKYVELKKALHIVDTVSSDEGIRRKCKAIRKRLKELPVVDSVEVKHGKWNILPDDPYNEDGCPTEAGWYRIITVDGEEMTDYYFNKPTLCSGGCTYWKDCRKGIRAWAKIEKEGAE